MKNHQPLGCQYKVDRNADENCRRASGGKSGVIHLESLRSVLLVCISHFIHNNEAAFSSPSTSAAPLYTSG